VGVGSPSLEVLAEEAFPYLAALEVEAGVPSLVDQEEVEADPCQEDLGAVEASPYLEDQVA
jgi:hypothetical protein